MPSSSRFIPYLLSTLLLSGCAGNDLMLKRQAESEAKIELLIQLTKKTEQRHNELAAALQVQEERLQPVLGDIRQLKDESRELRSSRDELKVRVAALVQQSLTPKVEIVNQPSPTGAAGEAGPPAEYLKSFGLYSANNFAAAITSFEAFLKDSPGSEHTANALYWIGECHYSLSDFTKAKEAFLKVVDGYPTSAKAPDALLRLGSTLTALKETEKAQSAFEKIITSYPSSPAAVKARQHLDVR